MKDKLGYLAFYGSKLVHAKCDILSHIVGRNADIFSGPSNTSTLAIL